MLRTDVHQHLWSEPLVEALARRSRPPFIRRNGHVWELTVPGEALSTIDVVGDEIPTRGALVHLDGLDVAVLSLSSVLGVEGLIRDEAADVIAGYEAGVRGLPDSFAAWGALPLRDAEPADAERVLAAGFAGLSLPAGAIVSPSGLERVGPLLEVAQRRAAPVFVHPGPDPFAPQAPAGADGPSWFPALTEYVALMNAAWHSFVAVGRKLLPDLRVVFAMLAGGAPLHLERLAARGGPGARAFDRNLYYDTSSYGERAIDAMVRVVGIDQLLHGSDRPVVAPPAPPGPLGAAAWEAMTRTNPARLFPTRARTAVAA
ncbi:MAG TPA: amidohydrolase family protein [Thermoleophilaceae bacterium]